MPKLQTVVQLRAFDEFKFWDYAGLNRSYITEEELLSKPISGKYESSVTIDLLSGFADLKHLAVIAYSDNGKDDLVEVTIDIEDAQGTPVSTQFSSPYLFLMGMTSSDYNTLTVTTTNATVQDPIFLKIFRLGS